jgi:hypothetical protein
LIRSGLTIRRQKNNLEIQVHENQVFVIH